MMQPLDWFLLLFLIILVILAFISWHKGKVKRCCQLGCDACHRKTNLCPHYKYKKDLKKRTPHSTE